LMVWSVSGLLCFGGSQILGKGIIGWWPFRGGPDFFARLVRVEVARCSGRIALIAFAGFHGQGVQSAAKLFVADGDGEEIVEVCGGTVMDICWSSDGERLYLLRSEVGGSKRSTKSLWRYTPSTGHLIHLRELPRLATLICLDPAEETLLFTGPRSGQGKGRFLLVRGLVNVEQEDRPFCWREGLQIGHAWGPQTGNMFVATSKGSSFGENYGLWMIQSDGRGASQPVVLLEMQGIEGIHFNAGERWAALFVRRWPPPCVDFDLYVLDMAEGPAMPIAPGVEWDSAVWDSRGKKLAFADRDGLWTYGVSSGRTRLLVEAPPSRLNPNRRERLKPLSYYPSGDIVFQRGFWRVEKYNYRKRNTATLFHVGELRRYFKS